MAPRLRPSQTNGCEPPETPAAPIMKIVHSHSSTTLVAVALGWPLMLSAQQPLDCEPCQIRLADPIVLGGPDGDGIASGHPNAIVQDVSGRFLYVDSQDAAHIAVFDSVGRFLRLVGNEGGGPSEYRSIATVATTDSTIHVFDAENRRETVLSPDFHIVRSVPAPFRPRDVLVLPNGQRVMNMDVPTRDLIGYPLHLVDGEGTILRSFGASPEPYRRDISYLGDRRLTQAGSDGEFWAAHRLRYEIELRDTTGRGVRRISRRAGWFPPASQWHGFHREDPPASLLWDIKSDGNGLLWTLIAVADRSWKDAIEVVRDEHGERWIPRSSREYFDTVIEVIDPRTNQVVASARSDYLLTHFVGEGFVMGPTSTEEANPTVRIWRITINQGEP